MASPAGAPAAGSPAPETRRTPPVRPSLSLSLPSSSHAPSTKSISGSTPTTTINTASTSTPSTPSTPIPLTATSQQPGPRIVPIRPVAASKAATPKAAPINKMSMASVISPSPAPPQLSMTSKEWVIPPRPKPGRKPATDTPPTKRKAQNRAAQRAFRERRAARVGELEEQLDEQKEEHLRREQELEDRIHHLEVESQALRSKCQWLESTLEKERIDRTSRTSSAAPPSTQHQTRRSPSLSSGQQHRDSGRHTSSASASVAETRAAPQPFSISQIISPLDQADKTQDLTCGSCEPDGRCACVEEVIAESSTLGCGKCAFGTTCACLDESLEAAAADAPDLKRPHPPGSPSSAAPGEKRQRPSDPDPDHGTAMEIDFTAIFSQKKRARPQSPRLPPQSEEPQVVSIEPKDQCGFCKDGTYCVCADSAPPDAESADAALSLPTPQPVSEQTRTPPPESDAGGPTPMEITETGAIKLPSLKSLSESHGSRLGTSGMLPSTKRPSTCGPGGPGTCAQCLSDPKSGLFCRSLAASFERSRLLPPPQGVSGGCCGGGGPGGCCKSGGGGSTDPVNSISSNDRRSARRKRTSSGMGLSLSCADTYKTLSSHRHFDEATDDIGDWLPKLRAAPAAPRNQHKKNTNNNRREVDRLAPIEVEAASIMSVLKGFDVRFGD